MKPGTMKAVLMIGAAMLFAACGGSGGGGGGTPPVAAPISGKFVDSPVDGLHYTSPPSNPAGGLTNNGGQYQCQPGDTVTFDLGGRAIGTGQPCGPIVTAVSVFGATSAADPRVVALSQLLLTLGGIPTGQNPIQLPATIPAGLPKPLNFSDPNFTTVLQNALPGTTVVTQAQATTHLQTSFTTLSVTVVNSGIVKSNPAGINCTAGTCSYDFVTGTGVTLAATGTGFTGWTGAGCGGTGTCVVALNANAAVTATFPVAPPPATLTISKAGTGTGTVNCSVTGGAFGACAASYPNGTALTLQGVADNGSTFTGWSAGTGNISCTGTNNCSVTLTANSAVTASFTLSVTQFSVTGTPVSANGGGGTVQCSANGGAPGPCGSYPVGTPISMIPTPNNASNFTGWTNGTGSVNANCSNATGPCNFTLTANTSIMAHFTRPTLSVVLAGTGSVSSNPPGINCGATCSAPFDKGTSITLTASGAGFTGWSGGGCSGTGTCMVPLNTDTTVTANFGQVTTSNRWLFYENGTGTIRYVDPANPGATTTALTTTGVQAARMIAPTWDSTNVAYTNLTAPYLTYFSGGKLWRVSAAKSSGVPGSGSNPPVQISSETAALTVCDENEVAHTTATSIKLFYELPGADGNCTTQNDNVTKWVSVSDNATTPPTALAPGLVLASVKGNGNGLSWVTDLSTGVPSHVFLLDAANSNTLKLLNLSTNAITTILANVGDADIVAQDTSDRVFLRGGTTKNILYVYTISTNSLVTLVTGASGLEKGNPAGDGTNLYVAEQANGKLYKAPMTATGPSDVVTLLASVGFPLGDAYGGDDVVVTTNDVFLHTYVPCSGTCTPPNQAQDVSGLYRVSKAGGAATPIIAHAIGASVFNVRSAGSLLYYNHQLPPTTPQANIINENGTSVFASPTSCFPCSGWSSLIGSPSFFVRTSSQPPSKVILGSFAASSAATWNGVTLTTFDAQTGTQGITLGVVPPTNPTLASVYGGDFIDTTALLVGGQNGTVNNFLFFVDTALAGSLTQVPTGTTGPWFPVN